MKEPKKILVVEDNPEMKNIITIRLEINGYSVITAEDGEQALEMAKQKNPDLIILDLMLPKITGFEVCRMLKFDDKYKNLPIIILSALDQQDDREKATKNGADAYFIKPFDLELLLSKIKSLIG
jgi:DNA-binding response OmpR family regulator